MKPRIIYAHGKIVKDNFYCPWCDRKRTGKIIHECYKWRVNLSCGHVVNRDYTLPVQELERKGLVNQPNKSEDPRFTAKKKQLFTEMMNRFEEAKRERWNREHLAGDKSLL